MEKVLVINTADLKKIIGNNVGFLAYDEKVLDLIKTKSFFVSRSDAEADETKKQIIPYCMVVNGNKILAVKRKNPSEQRLKDLLSIGIGGHINPTDTDKENVLRNSAIRELKEELKFFANADPQVAGFLNIDNAPVDRVHFGVVYKVDLGSDVEVIDEGLEGDFVSMNELPKLSGKMEGWSKVLAGDIIGGRRSSQDAVKQR